MSSLERARLRRLPEKGRYDPADWHEVIDRALFVHVAATVDGLAMALPTLAVRDGDTVYLHGSRSNAVMRALVEAGEGFVTATLFDGLRVATTGFESSIAYRSAALFGTVRRVEGDEAARALDLFVDHLIPGRLVEVRPMTEREKNLTAVVALEVTEASAKHSAGPTDQADEPAWPDAWSGFVPYVGHWGAPVADSDAPLPDSIKRLTL